MTPSAIKQSVIRCRYSSPRFRSRYASTWRGDHRVGDADRSCLVNQHIHLCGRGPIGNGEPRRHRDMVHARRHRCRYQPAPRDVQRSTRSSLSRPTSVVPMGWSVRAYRPVVRTRLGTNGAASCNVATGFFFFIAWNVSVVAGMVVGSRIPSEWRLDVAPAVMFAGLVVLGLSNWPGLAAAITGAGVCFLALGVPNNGGILIGAISGVVAGYVADVVLDGRGLSTRGFPQ